MVDPGRKGRIIRGEFIRVFEEIVEKGNVIYMGNMALGICKTS